MKTIAIFGMYVGSLVRWYIGDRHTDARNNGQTEPLYPPSSNLPSIHSSLARRTGALLALALLLGFVGAARAAGPDLTDADTRYTIDTAPSTYNLGPTGMRGWIYLNGSGSTLQATSIEPWQILVTAVGVGTPANGIILNSDVILGAQAGSGGVPLFTNDARKSLGLAIGDAEARADGNLSLLINRYGVGNLTRTITLGLKSLSYSATAPYNCSKSARILSDATAIISPLSFNCGDPGNPVLGLAKLAVGDTTGVKTYANSICPGTGTLHPEIVYDSWVWGYKNLFLCEYRLYSGDTSVDAGITELSTSLEEAQGASGLLGHRFTEPHPDGTHGGVGGYGPMHSCSIPPGISLVLAKKCGISGFPTAQINEGIDRISKFESCYAGKGPLPYGEHEPFMTPGRGSNGKDQMAAVLFGLQGNMPTQTEYYTRANVASFLGYEYGHTGQGFSYLWGPLGAHIGGTNALAAYLKPLLWRLDMARRSDGSFTYDGQEQFGGRPNCAADYWNSASYNGLDPTTSHVLLYALPQRRIYLTGKNPNPTNTLNSAAVSNAVWAGWYATKYTGYTTNELISHFSEFDPVVRWLAARELAKRPASADLVPTLIAMTTNTNPRVREASCQALGAIKDSRAVSALVARLSDQDVLTHTKAGLALGGFGTTTLPYFTNMVAAYMAYGSKDRYDIDWNDPLLFANGSKDSGLAYLLFGILGSYVKTTPLFSDVMAVGLACPESYAQWQPANLLLTFSWNDVKTNAAAIVATAKDPALFDRMFGWDQPIKALQTLAKYNVGEGIPLAVRLVDKYLLYDGIGNDIIYSALCVLSNSYRGSAKDALPALNSWLSWGADSAREAAIRDTIDAINTLDGPDLVYFKSTDVTAAPITWPATTTTLKSSGPDLDNGITYYMWKKISGPGTVSFSLNNSIAASNTVATFGAAGTYVLQMGCVDKSILDSTTWRWGWAPTSAQTYTNIMGAAYGNFTCTVYTTPFVNITNVDTFVTDRAAVLIGGTNNAVVEGIMTLESRTGAVVTYSATMDAETPWAIMVSNLVVGATNVVTVTGMNGAGMATGDTVRIFRFALPFLQITNTPPGLIILPGTTTTWPIAGTNTASVVGMITWTNPALANAGGLFSPASRNWSTNVPLRMGFNYLAVSGTNCLGTADSDTYTIVRGSPPILSITNISTTETLVVPSTTTSQYIAGTNNMVVGVMTWTNSMGGGGQFAAASPWSFSAPLFNGNNSIIVSGTNIAGAALADTATVYRAIQPFVNITNADFAISMAASQATIGGTATLVVVGGMTLESMTGAVVTCSQNLAAARSWSAVVTNLIPGVTNVVTMTGTNVMGEATNDIVRIYRRPLACVDITNISGTVWVPMGTTTKFIAGTNTTTIIGRMWWTNSMGGGGAWGAGSTGWSFNATLATVHPGINIITVYGTNTSGDIASDSVTVQVLVPTDFFWTNRAGGAWSRAANWTNNTGQAAAPQAAGLYTYRLNFACGGAFSATNDLNNGFRLNQLIFSNTTVTLTGNGLVLTNDGALLPQINQNGSVGATILTDLAMPTNVTFGGKGSGAITYSGGMLSGEGTLIKNGSYTLTIKTNIYLSPHTYSGGSILNAGTLTFSLKACGTGPITVNGGTFQHQSAGASVTNTLVFNGGTFGGNTYYGPVILNAIPTISVGNNYYLYGVMSGTGGFSLVKGSSWIISGNNTYTGPTSVTNATLRAPSPLVLGSGPLTIKNKGKADLPYFGTREVFSLALGGVKQRGGTFGSTASDATYKSDVYFSGMGTVTVKSPVAITNIPGFLYVPDTAATWPIAGTNAPSIVGTIAWTNSRGGCGTFDATPCYWEESAVPLTIGINVITVSGTNTEGVLFSDAVTIVRSIAPFVDITNANFAAGARQTMICGTNNAGPVGFMSVVSMTGSTTNYAASVPATTPWSIMVSNIIEATTNFVTVTGTNIVGTATNDTVQIYCRNLAFINITNLTHDIYSPRPTQYISGTNNILAVGRMWWTDSMGGSGSWGAGPTGWSFTVSLTQFDPGIHTITVFGSNAVGDVASDAVSISVPVPARPTMFFWTNTAGGVWSDGNNWTNDLASGTAPTAAGSNAYRLYFNCADTFSALNDLNNGFRLNQLNVSNTTVTLGGNGLVLTNNGALLPQINQDGSFVVNINNDLSLPTNVTFGGTGSGMMTCQGGMISGKGSLIKNGTFQLRISTNSTLEAHSYSGGTILNSGTLNFLIPAEEMPDGPLCGSGRLTINGGSFLYPRADESVVNPLVFNGGSWSGDGKESTWYGPVTVNAIVAMNPNASLTFDAVADISGLGGFCLMNYTQTFNGATTYTGPTILTNGTLNCNDPLSLGSGVLAIGTGAVVNLNYDGMREISGLTLGGITKPNGIYGSTNSDATFQSLYFGGSGTVSVSNVLPFVNITNVIGSITATNTSQYIAGTNSMDTVSLWWTNSLGGGGTLDPAPGSWNTNVALSTGVNVITVYGANYLGTVDRDTYTSVCVVTPFVDITNAAFSVGDLQTTIGGTNNAGPAGFMRVVSRTGTTTNYAASVPATTPWTIVVSNLVPAATNVVTVTGTNFVGTATNDTIQIYCRPLAFVNITNIAGTVYTATTTQYIAGTNNNRTVGGMWWTNSAGGGGSWGVGTTGWSFNATLSLIYPGLNVITVFGSNSVGDVASDSVSLYGPTTNTPTAFFWINTGGGVWSDDRNWTNDLGDGSAPIGPGKPSYRLYFNKAGTYSASNDLNDGFLLNQINFGGATVTLGGNGLVLTNNGALLPQVNQNGSATVTIYTDLRMATNTAFGGTGVGVVNCRNGMISGSGTLIKDGPCTLSITTNSLNQAHAYSGGTILNSGMLNFNLAAAGLPPACGTGPITVNGGSFAYDRAGTNCTTTIVFNDGTWAGDSADAWYGPVIVNDRITINQSSSLALYDTVSGLGGFLLMKNTLTLADTNTYTGPTILTNGTLNCNNTPLSLGPGQLAISGTGKVNLNYAGTRTIAALSLDGTNQPNGTYGSTNSTATYKSIWFRSNGIVQVVYNMPFVDITNITGTVIVLSTATNQYIAGTNSIKTVGRMWWTNSMGGGGAWGAGTTGWSFRAALQIGTNMIAVSGTNSLGNSDFDTIYVVRSMPCVNITNISGTIFTTNATQYIAGTNDPTIAGRMWWTNSLGGGGTWGAGNTGWCFTATLQPGANLITVNGTNASGYLVSDSVGVGLCTATKFFWTNTIGGVWNDPGNWTNDLGDGTAPIPSGYPSYRLYFNGGGTFTAINDLNEGFLLNQINFGGAMVTLSGNGLVLTNNGALLPQVNQNSSVSISVTNNLALNADTTMGGSGSGEMSFFGVISGTGSVTKTSSGTVTLWATDTYRGKTMVTAGTLKLAEGWGISDPAAAPVSADASSIYGSGYEPDRAIDGSGMTPNDPVVLTSTCGNTGASGAGGGEMWRSGAGAPQWIAFDLGSVRTICGFHHWNYNASAYTIRGAKDVDVYYGTYSTYTDARSGSLAQSYTLAQAPGTTDYMGEDYTFTTPVVAQYIQVYVNNSWGGGWIGSSEIRFDTVGGDSSSIANTPVISIAGGATYDVSAAEAAKVGAGTLGSWQTLEASGSTSSGTLATEASHGLTLDASSPLRFTAFKPAGSGGAVPLILSGAGTLTLGASAPVTVTVSNSGAPLTAAGSPYKLIGKGDSGTIATLPGGTLTVNGDGVSGTPSLQITSGELYLQVSGPFVDITNANVTVAAAVTNTMIGGTNNALAAGFMRLVSKTGTTTNYAATIPAATSWTIMVSNLVEGATNFVTMTVTNSAGAPASDSVEIYRLYQPKPSDVQTLNVGRGADYGQMQLSWSNGTITVLACTNRLYSTNAADWFVMASGVATPWTHTDASDFPSVYYRIVSGTYTSQYAVGKYDVNIAAGSIAWISFPFGVQAGCDALSDWFGRQLEARPMGGFNYPSLQKQNGPGGYIQNRDYYISGGVTNWSVDEPVVANVGYILFLPQDHPAIKVTGIGMVQTNNVTMQIPYKSIPWVGLAYDVVIDMKASGITNLFQPPQLYSSFNFDFVDSQQALGGPVWYAEYYRDNWGTGATNFFSSVAGADKIEPGKGYLIFFSTARAGTGVWTCVKPY